ncbi:helix-turn-helix transcriptional regulator [Mucilaginibacter terrae]|uniref:helix-turn-helix transcriptional regulator n=1 Tax=Mucilaginibacter terrae TaxID=1955052 RepID=UPI00363FFC50
MEHNEINRLSRLTSILIQLQSKRLVTAPKLAAKYGVTPRTIYRDMKALETSGVPIVCEEGRGYSLMEGYRIPPVMFTINEANALITAEFIIRACKDESLIKEFSSAIEKIKAVIPNALKAQIEILEQKIGVTKTYTDVGPKSKYLLSIQKALTEHQVITINYINAAHNLSVRDVEPFAVYSNQNDEWVLVAYCRLRKEFRTFSLTGIQKLSLADESFDPHSITFAAYRKQAYGK